MRRSNFHARSRRDALHAAQSLFISPEVKPVSKKKTVHRTSYETDETNQRRFNRGEVVRLQALRKLVSDSGCSIERLAALCVLSEGRMSRLCSGEDAIDSQMAMHIEVTLGLPSGWMEGDVELTIPTDVIELIKSDRIPFDEDHAESNALISTNPKIEAFERIPDEGDMDHIFQVYDEPQVMIEPQSFAATQEEVGGVGGKDDFAGLIASLCDEDNERLPLHQEAAREVMSAVTPSSSEFDDVLTFGEEAESEIQTAQSRQDSQGGQEIPSQTNIEGNQMTSISENRDVIDAANAAPAYLLLKEVFPAVRVFLKENTELSSASISGILSGSRELTDRNARLFEQVLGAPEGWLHESMTIEQAREDMMDFAPTLLDIPAPRRGRKAGTKLSTAPARAPMAVAKKAAHTAKRKQRGQLIQVASIPEATIVPVASAASQPSAVTHAAPAVAQQAEAVHHATPQIATQVAPQAYAKAVPQAATSGGATLISVTSSDMASNPLAYGFMMTVNEMVRSGQMDNKKISRLLNVLYE